MCCRNVSLYFTVIRNEAKPILLHHESSVQDTSESPQQKKNRPDDDEERRWLHRRRMTWEQIKQIRPYDYDDEDKWVKIKKIRPYDHDDVNTQGPLRWREGELRTKLRTKQARHSKFKINRVSFE